MEHIKNRMCTDNGLSDGLSLRLLEHHGKPIKIICIISFQKPYTCSPEREEMEGRRIWERFVREKCFEGGGRCEESDFEREEEA